jgi:hypothetical protein
LGALLTVVKHPHGNRPAVSLLPRQSPELGIKIRLSLDPQTAHANDTL